MAQVALVQAFFFSGDSPSSSSPATSLLRFRRNLAVQSGGSILVLAGELYSLEYKQEKKGQKIKQQGKVWQIVDYHVNRGKRSKCKVKK